MSKRFEYYTTGANWAAGIYGSTWYSQTFTPAIAHTIRSVKLKLYRSGFPGTITVSIRTTDGNGKPTGNDLCSGTTNGDTLTGSSGGGWREITFSSSLNLSVSTKYAIVAKAPSGDASNWAGWIANTSGDYNGGNLCWSTDSGSSWDANAYDLYFEDWGVLTAPYLNIDVVAVDGDNNGLLDATDEPLWEYYWDLVDETPGVATGGTGGSWTCQVEGDLGRTGHVITAGGSCTGEQAGSSTLWKDYTPGSNRLCEYECKRRVPAEDYDRRYDIDFDGDIEEDDAAWVDNTRNNIPNLGIIRDDIRTGTKQELKWDNWSCYLYALTETQATLWKFAGSDNQPPYGWIHVTKHSCIPSGEDAYYCHMFAIDTAQAAYKALGYGCLMYATNGVDHAYNIFWNGSDWTDLNNWWILEPQGGAIVNAGSSLSPTYQTAYIYFFAEVRLQSGYYYIFSSYLDVDYANKTVAIGGTGKDSNALSKVNLEEAISDNYVWVTSLGNPDVITPAPLILIEAEASSPSISLDLILLPPLILIEAEALLPEMILAGAGITLILPLATIDEQCLEPVLSLGLLLQIPIISIGVRALNAICPTLSFRDWVVHTDLREWTNF